MSIKTRKHTKRIPAFFEMGKYHIRKITLDVSNNYVLVECLKDLEGKKPDIFLIKPDSKKESKSNLIPGLSKSNLIPGLIVANDIPPSFQEAEIISVPFSEVVNSINLKQFLILFSEMIAE